MVYHLCLLELVISEYNMVKILESSGFPHLDISDAICETLKNGNEELHGRLVSKSLLEDRKVSQEFAFEKCKEDLRSGLPLYVGGRGEHEDKESMERDVSMFKKEI